MSLTSGSRLGPYEIQSLLGEGGMGQVYKARDSKLGRDVAIKVLPASVANDPERLARFEREAKLLASLSHTNIAQIYGLEDGGTIASGGRFLVMELAPGEDLTLRIARGPMDLHDALPVVIQIAHALEAAHERAIVHRDLKPANIKISDEGAVKVLDFGLAKALASGDSGSAEVMNSPTLTAQATAAGIILGTAAYMSPEQARGREADKRADVWAFGVVFFELLTGARLFQGETISDTLAAVLRQDIPWSALPVGTPAEIVRLLKRCLERDRKNRLHDIADARIVLEEVARGGAKEDVAAAPATSPRRPWFLIATMAGAALALGVLLGRWTTPAPVVTGGNTIRLVIKPPPDVTEVEQPAVSPDGSFVVFVGFTGTAGRRLYIQGLGETAPRPIERTEGAILPIVSADSKWIAYQKTNRLEKIAVDGGEPLLVTELPRTGGPNMAWVPRGPIVFTTSWLSGLSAVSPDHGPIRPISTLDTARGEIGHWFPNALPDGHHALMTIWIKGTGISDAEIALLNLDTGKHTILFKGAEGRYLAPGYIVFFRAGAYHAIRFNPDTRLVTGDPVRVLDDAAGNSPAGDNTQTDLSATGTLAYRSGPYILPRELAWISAGGKIETLPFPIRSYENADVTRDGKRIAVAALEGGRYLLRLLNADGREHQLDLPGSSWKPVWHPDGKRLAFVTMRKGDFDTYWLDVTASGASTPLLASEFDDMPMSFVPDGSAWIVQQSESSGAYPLKRVPIAPPGPPVTLVPFTSDVADVSPDGKFLVFQSSRSGTLEMYVQSMTGDGAPEQISKGGGSAGTWAANGHELLYLREPEIVAVPFTVEAGRFRAGTERVWARVEGTYNTSVLRAASDGRVLVIIDRKRTQREIRVIVNWQQEIAKKLK